MSKMIGQRSTSIPQKNRSSHPIRDEDEAVPESIEDKLTRLGISLPPISAPIANYVPFVISGNLLFTSGQGPKTPSENWLRGRVGDDTTIEQAYKHARLTGTQVLAVVQSALGSLDRVHRVVKILGFVNANPRFTGHPQVVNGCSDLMVEVFGDKGRHARSAVGVGSLPENLTVEIEAIFEIR
jgi:enamine deaminase RidA (YjgF/YER057c/UK114 family)